MPTTTTRRTKSQWRELIEAQASSELSQKAFCEQQGVSIASFGYWKRKLKPGTDTQGSNRPIVAKPAAETSDAWIELPLAVQSSKRKTGAWTIELDLGQGVSLRLTQQA